MAVKRAMISVAGSGDPVLTTFGPVGELADPPS